MQEYVAFGHATRHGPTRRTHIEKPIIDMVKMVFTMAEAMHLGIASGVA